MFKKTKWLSITLASLLLTGCGGSNDTTNTIPTIIESESITSPLVENNTTDTTSPVVIENNTTNTTPPTVENNTTDTTTSPVVVENNTTNTTPPTVENNTTDTPSPVVVENNTTNTTPPTVENNTTNTQVALTIYEDAQDGLVDGWVIYKEDNETNISNIYDVDKASNVIKLERGAMSDTYFVLGDKNSGWANNDSNTIQWSMNTTNTFKITILVETTNGTRYIKYDDSNTNRGQYKEDSIQYGLGTASKDGTWKTFTRNLALDLKDANRSSLLPEIQQAEANNTIVSINGFRIDGNMRVDNIAMIQDGTVTEDTNTTVVESPTIPNPVETNTTTVTDQNQTIDINGTIINVSNTAEFKSALTTAQDGDTILLAPGIYDNLNEIVILQNNLTIASHLPYNRESELY